MKKTRICLVMFAATAATASALFCAGCDDKRKYDTVTVSTAAELEAASKNNNIITLAADLDLADALISPIKCHGFDGNGHTVSNVIVNGASFFDAEEFVKNVTFDNLTVNSRGNAAAAFIASEIEKYDYTVTMNGHKRVHIGMTLENVNVKNSTLTVKNDKSVNVGGLIGYEDSDDAFHSGGMTGNVISGCAVTDCTFDVTTETGIAKVGGIFGTQSEAGWKWNELAVSDCSVTGCKFDVNRGCYVGGLFGDARGAFSKCYSENNSITAEDSSMYNGNFLVPASGAGNVNVGGLFGRLVDGSTVRLCYARDNDLTTYSSARYAVGGLGGTSSGKSTVNQCYAVDTGVIAGGRYEKDKETRKRYFGGLIGYVGGGVVASCFAAGTNYINDNDKPSSAVGEERHYGGLIGGVGENVTVQYCAAKGLSADETAHVDNFCPTTGVGLLSDCYADGQYGNVNSCAAISSDAWLTPSVIKTMLNLFDPCWNLTAGQMPSLDIR